ncbi:hypothetical protein [Methanobrevibacter sp. V14]|uniref:hypothetical protein n=1 Tax=Methanobrevibacter sp. V14 TaxID=3064280 RepID=UPI002733D108|nr:hypothetical protein [Methanobrevibacter sp. V14]
MNEKRIMIGDPWNNTCMGKQDAIDLFEDIPNDVDKIIFDFGNILYVGFLFVKEYFNLKESIDVNISEINVWDRVQETFDMVEEFGVTISDEKLIQKFIDYD